MSALVLRLAAPLFQPATFRKAQVHALYVCMLSPLERKVHNRSPPLLTYGGLGTVLNGV